MNEQKYPALPCPGPLRPGHSRALEFTTRLPSLHYLQMLTEKLAKAYFWRGPGAEDLGHAAFVKFIRSIATSRRVAEGIGYTSMISFREWIAEVSDLAYELERLAPALAANGPNPEYPWPRAMPEHTPAEHDFVFWRHFRSRNGFGCSGCST